MKKVDTRTQKLESSKEAQSQEQLNKLKRLGVFVKTYNMSHLLATRYKVEEDFGITKSVENLDKLEVQIKEKQASLNKKENEKETKESLEASRKDLGAAKDQYKTSLRSVKSNIGTELYERYNRGFARTRDNREENEKVGNAEFLFKKLYF